MPRPSRSSQELLEREQARGNARDLGSVLLNYGLFKSVTGDYAVAETLLERAVATLESAGERDSPPLAESAQQPRAGLLAAGAAPGGSRDPRRRSQST